MSIAPPASAPPGATRQWRRFVAPTTDDSATPTARSMAEAILPASMLHEDEVILLLIKPSPLFILLTSLRFVLGVLLTAILAVRVLDLHESALISNNGIAILATLLVLGRLVWALAVWTSHVYFLTNQRVVTIKGVFNLSIVQAPLRKIQRTTLYRPFIERILGLGSIGFATAATTDYDATWVMIAHPTAIHEQIVAAIRRIQ